MTRFASALIGLVFALSASAQTQLTEAVDFTVTDLEGQEHTLSEYLDAGKFVCIDFFAHFCSTCANVAPAFAQAFNHFGCNGGEVIFLSIETQGNTQQTESFEANLIDSNPPPAVSGTDGGGQSVFSSFAVQSYPTLILIQPDWTIVEQGISPFTFSNLSGVLQSHGLEEMSCVSSVEDEPTVALTAWPNPAQDALQVEAAPGTQLALIDLVGREVVRTVALHNRTVLDLTTVPNGSYLLRAHNADATETRKVIVRH